MYTFIIILILIVCVLLALVVLVQNSKGGGLAANFSAPTQVMGVRQSADFIEKARSEERRVGKECRSRWSPYH